MSDIIEHCMNMEENCLGGTGNTSLENCKEGHYGALCEECDLESKYWGESYSNTRAEPFLCAKCSSDFAGNIARIVGIYLFILLSIGLYVRSNISAT